MDERLTEASALLHAVSQWLDDAPANRARDREARTWGRVAKVSEEAGEVVSALIGATGHNPRKGTYATMSDVERELLDVAMTALCAVAHLHAADREQTDVLGLLGDHIHAVAQRAGLL
ncbi:MazG-like family protein [Streptomyces sp. NBC_01262]|uniref:MazG-like family protein n=1 Tax=Streptomyces sp. NBC_01262 TaxID=2903803 RepID=UPI002E340AB2|nr:MazG-like family protein [Streptomyces sp. NBC_01262]